MMNSNYLNLPLIGQLKIISNKKRIIEIKFISESTREEIDQGKALSSTLPEEVENLKNQLIEYFQSKRQKFQINYIISGTDFQQKILRETARIPYGQTISYKELAEKAGSPRAWQATGQALKNNKLPIVIPCHRVVGIKGLGGYNGGLKLKKLLLSLEESY